MSYGELLNSIPSNCKELPRKLETEEKRLIKIRSSKQFSEKFYVNNHLLNIYINLFIKNKDI